MFCFVSNKVNIMTGYFIRSKNNQQIFDENYTFNKRFFLITHFKIKKDKKRGNVNFSFE